MEQFAEYLKTMLIPALSKTDIIVMDNMRSHHAKIVKQVLDESEINDLYLPPYSPDLNPIEKIIGQVQAIDRMIDEDVPCEDILSQINAAKSALHKVGQVVLEGHIKHCVRDGIEHGDADKTIENFTKAVERFANMN